MIYVEVSFIIKTVFFSAIVVFTDAVRMTMTVRFFISMPDAMYYIFNIMPIAFYDNCVRDHEPMARCTPSLENQTSSREKLVS